MEKTEFFQTLFSWHQAQFPETVSFRKVGLEKELPVIRQDNHLAADARQLFPLLVEASWQPFFDEVNQDVVLGVKHPLSKIEITTEAGFCTFELIMPPEDNIQAAILKLDECEKLIRELALSKGMIVLSYGIQPKSQPGNDLWIKKRRHQVIRQVLPQAVDAVTITASDQVHLDITREEVVDAVNVFNALSGLIIHLFANSPIWLGNTDAFNRLSVREDLWFFAPQDRMGIHAKPYQDLAGYLSVMSGLDQLLTKENGDYLPTGGSYLEYVLKNPQTDWQYHWKLLEGMTWPNARARTPYGTIEIRPACTSSLEGTACLAALCLGLLEKLTEVKELVDSYPWLFWQHERSKAIIGIKDQTSIALLKEVLCLANSGLKQRQMGEERFLGVLDNRLKQGENPAQLAISTLKHRGWDAFIKSVSL